MSARSPVAEEGHTGKLPVEATQNTAKVTQNAIGYVLAGGLSSRMGRDKALLPWGETTLIQHIASIVGSVVNDVVIVGDLERYGGLGYPVTADVVPGKGPLGGLYTALSHTHEAHHSDWILMVACDMPRITDGLLRDLLADVEDAVETGTESGAAIDAVVPETSRGLEPLCAAYHVRILPQVEAVVRSAEESGDDAAPRPLKLLKMQRFITTLSLKRWAAPHSADFTNLNTPENWAEVRNELGRAR